MKTYQDYITTKNHANAEALKQLSAMVQLVEKVALKANKTLIYKANLEREKGLKEQALKSSRASADAVKMAMYLKQTFKSLYLYRDITAYYQQYLAYFTAEAHGFAKIEMEAQREIKKLENNINEQ